MLENAAWLEYSLPDVAEVASTEQPPKIGQSIDAMTGEVRRTLIAAENGLGSPRRWFSLLSKLRAAIIQPEIAERGRGSEIAREG